MASTGGTAGPGGGGGSRAFAQKLVKHHAIDIRRQAAAELKSGGGGPGGGGPNSDASAAQQRLLAAQIGRTSVSYHHVQQSSSSATLSSTSSLPLPMASSPAFSVHHYGDGSTAAVEPVDYEEFLIQQNRQGERDPLAHVLEFPRDDLEVKVVPRKIRTMGHVLPEESIEQVDPSVQNCVECYTSDFVVVRRKFQEYSSSVRQKDESVERLRLADMTPAQEFEVDDTPDASPDYDQLGEQSMSQTRHWRRSLNMSMPNSLGGSLRSSMMSLDAFQMVPRSSSLTTVKFRTMDDGTRSLSGFDVDVATICGGSSEDDEDGDSTPINSGNSPVCGSLCEDLDSKRLSDLLEAMSTPRIVHEASARLLNERPDRQETPRGSWATFDLRNSEPDPPVVGLLDPVDAETVDAQNEARRVESRMENVFALFPAQPESERVERRMPPDEPSEPQGHRILVQCNKLELSLQVEPIFASMALYDAKERKKVSENFYFDMNTEQLRRMLEGYIPQADYSTQARACVFEVTNASPDLFLVVKLEKVLQGDINEAAEPYLKEAQNLDKVRANAYDACNRLGKYRMPFAWTAIWLQNITKGKDGGGADSGGSDAESTASNSLDRKSSTSNFEQFRRSANVTAGGKDSHHRRGSLERSKRSSWAGDDFNSQLDAFAPVTLTVSSFFKQESDKLKDDDLYKFLLDLKRPAALKRLKCIRGTLKLDISVAPEQTKYCFTPELTKLIPFPDMKARPTKEILEFPPRELLQPNYHFRNLLYVCPKELNFTNRSGERARNIAVKVQLMGDDDSLGLKVIYGKSSCPEFTTEAYTAVTYHNKTPDFYEEVKMKLPSNLRERHHLLFTFYHISCQGQRKEQISTEVPVGYTWIPIFRGGSLQTGLFELPVMLEPPPAALRYIPTDSGGAPPGTKWVDNKKPIFAVELTAFTTVHALDPYLDRFLNLTATLQLGSNQNSNERATEEQLLKLLTELPRARLEPLSRFLPLVLDKLLLLMVRPPSVAGHVLNVAQAAFAAVAAIVNKISTAPELTHLNDRHGRNALLASYVHFQAHLPHPDLRAHQSSTGRPKSAPASRCPGAERSSGISLLADEEVGNIIMMGQPTSKNGLNDSMSSTSSSSAKLVHEQLALQWSIASGSCRDAALAAGWFFLELTSKAMVEHLATTSRLTTPRKARFSDQFHDDVLNLVAKLTSDIVCRHRESPEVIERVNSALAFFLQDLLSVMDRGFVFSLIRTYMRDVNSRMTNNTESLPLWLLQLDFVRIVCSHEHFVPLNLPSLHPSSDAPSSSSPSPSIRSNDSQSSFIALGSSSTGQERQHWSDLTSDFRKKHFLVGLVLSLLSKSFEQSSAEVHSRAVNAVRALLASHDGDDRYASGDCRARVASLYLPLVAIVLDNLEKLFSWPTEGETRIVGAANQNEHLNLILTAISDNVPNARGPIILKEETTRNLLTCVIWVLKNVEKSVLKMWWSDISIVRLQTLLEVLRICISCFQYKRRGKSVVGFKSEPNLWMASKVTFSLSLGLPRSPSDGFRFSPPAGADAPSDGSDFYRFSRESSPHIVQGRRHMRTRALTKCCSRQHQQPQKLRSQAGSTESLDLSYLALETRLLSFQKTKGKKLLRKHATLGTRKGTDVRSRLEDMIMGQNSNRADFLSRSSRKDRAAPSSPNPDVGRRWQKSTFLRTSGVLSSLSGGGSDTGSIIDGGSNRISSVFFDPEVESHLEGLLATEASMVVLDSLELVVQVASQVDQSSGLLASVLRVLLHALATNQSTEFLRHLFAVQRSFVFKFPSLLFDEAAEHCSDLCLRLLRHCSSSISAVRSQSSASLYLLMRQNFEIGNNFARVKMQVTMSLSKLVGTISNFNEDYLRKSLKTILVYAEQDQELSDTSFPEQVQDLVFNLHMILSDTVKMKEYIDDPEMHMDLMYRIAKGYQNSPDLRLTWLESMATKHEQYGHYAEAGMCKVHCAALISEYLHMLEDRAYMPTGAVTFSRLTPNALEESAVSDDVVVSPGDQEGICTGKNFTEKGLRALLDSAAKCFSQAGMYETVNEVFRAALPIAEAARDFRRLSEMHAELSEAFRNVHKLRGKRIFGTYFRVGFYGARFGDLDGEEYVYKEKALAKLPEIAHRLENFYGEKFGKENVIIIKDSKIVELSKLNPEKAYIQVTYVEPYFDNFELRDRITIFERNFNIIRFIFATPFTPDGSPHGELHEQYKRKTILTTSHHFPYVKTRIQVVERKQIVLTPIEVAIEDVQKKIAELEAATNQEPPDPKILQMVLQGCIGTTVNQGPMEVANVFLRDLFEGGQVVDKHRNKLRLCFKDFDQKCDEALRRNKKLISNDQKEYQKELEKNYARFHNHMSPLFRTGHNHQKRESPRMHDDVNESKVTSPMV